MVVQVQVCVRQGGATGAVLRRGLEIVAFVFPGPSVNALL